MRWPMYADAMSVAEIQELYEAGVDVLRHGEHDGDCDNDGAPDEACRLHIAASDARHARLQAAIEGFDTGEGQ